MNKIALGFLTVFASGTAGAGLVAARQEPTIRPNSYVGEVALGGLTPDEARRQLRIWWEGEKLHKLKLELAGTKAKLPAMTPGQLGVTLDDITTVQKLPLQGFMGNVSGAISRDAPDRTEVKPSYKANGLDLKPLAKIVDATLPKPKSAKVTYRGGIHRVPEQSAQQLDLASLTASVTKALEAGEDSVSLPVTAAPKHVPDAELAKITDVVSQFTTRFSAGNRSRSSNIRLAASKIDGVVLMPGERFSFNGTVGRRTLAGGFKVAGVYVNGRHDTGVGGGICQVSTTLYNAALFANLGVRQRSNHSLPVPYVPIGRDATVDYGSLDLVLENTTPNPIAIVSTYRPGALTFRLLGQKQPGLKVRITESGRRSWDPKTTVVIDRKLPPGARRVVEAGGRGQSVTTYRVVYQDGKVVRREPLGRSTYGGGTRLIATNPAPKIAKPIATNAVPATTVTPTVPIPAGQG